MCYTTSTLLTLLILLRLPAAAAAAGAPLRLWPGPAPNETRQIGAESRVQDGDQRGCGAARDAPCDRIENVSVPTLTPYLVDQSTTGVGTGTAVIIAPGGGYSILAISKEGEDVARMYNALGVSAFVLKYRVPARADRLGLPHWWAPLQDAQRAVSTVKYYAQKGKWDGKINASRVGFAGFSAEATWRRACRATGAGAGRTLPSTAPTARAAARTLPCWGTRGCCCRRTGRRRSARA